VRFHDGRHTALTRLAEKGQPDWVIHAQMGHVSPAMMRTFTMKFPRHKPKTKNPQMRQAYVTVRVTVGRSEEGDPRER
jgi:integrase